MTHGLPSPARSTLAPSLAQGRTPPLRSDNACERNLPAPSRGRHPLGRRLPVAEASRLVGTPDQQAPRFVCGGRGLVRQLLPRELAASCVDALPAGQTILDAVGNLF